MAFAGPSRSVDSETNGNEVRWRAPGVLSRGDRCRSGGLAGVAVVVSGECGCASRLDEAVC